MAVKCRGGSLFKPDGPCAKQAIEMPHTQWLISPKGGDPAPIPVDPF